MTRMRKSTRSILMGLIALLCATCSDSVKDASPAEAIKQYVGALQASDFDGAMAMRCAKAQLEPVQKAVFLADVGRLRTDAGGELKVREISELKPVRLLDDTGALFPHEFRVRLDVTNHASSAIHLATVSEGGGQKVCGWSVEESFGVRDHLATTTLAATPVHVDDVRDIVAGASTSVGGTVVDVAPTKGTGGAGVEGWTVGWRTGTYGGGRLSIIRYASVESAVSHANDIINDVAPDSTSMFTVSPLPEAQALRYTGLAWTGIQPADLGAQIDLAVAVYDDAVLWLTTSGLDPTEDHSKLTTLAESVHELLDA